MLLKYKILPLFLVIGVVGFSAHADAYLHSWGYHHQKPKRLSLTPQALLYTTDSNFNSAGEAKIPVGFDRLNRIHAVLEADYGLSRRFTAYTRLTWARVELKHSTLSGTSYGGGDQMVGAHFVAWESPIGIKIGTQAEVEFPSYSNADNRTKKQPYLGDGSTNFTLGAFASIPIDGSRRHWWAHGGFGHTWRTNQYSAAFPWSIEAKHKPEDNGVLVSLGFYGQVSRKTDESSLSISGTGAGGSNTVNAVNPSLLSFKGQLGYQFDHRFAAVGTFTNSFWGNNAPRGYSAGAGLQITLGGISDDEPTAEFNESSDPGPKSSAVKGFLNYATKATVVRVNDRLNILKIDKGQEQGVLKGQIFDIFSVKPDGSVIEVVARARVTDVQSNEAALKITEYFKEVWIEEGFIARRLIQ